MDSPPPPGARRVFGGLLPALQGGGRAARRRGLAPAERTARAAGDQRWCRSTPEEGGAPSARGVPASGRAAGSAQGGRLRPEGDCRVFVSIKGLGEGAGPPCPGGVCPPHHAVDIRDTWVAGALSPAPSLPRDSAPGCTPALHGASPGQQPAAGQLHPPTVRPTLSTAQRCLDTATPSQSPLGSALDTK